MADPLPRWLVPLAGTVTAILVGLFIYLAFTALDSKGRIGNVPSVAPCRERGPDDVECQRQARLILQSCIGQQSCRVLLREIARSP